MADAVAFNQIREPQKMKHTNKARAETARHAKVTETTKGLREKPVTPCVYRGRSERIRTFDPLIPNQMRYQAALRSDKPQIIAFSRAIRNQKGGNTARRVHAG
jgi:hypothetical protein